MICAAKRDALRFPDLMFLVADEIPRASRQLLREHGWGYLDRRGRLAPDHRGHCQ